MKKICISPKISRRPSSISSELETLNAAGIAEDYDLETMKNVIELFATENLSSAE